ncbi:hypothetical protein V2W45_1332282 [Cenococcum geophilum]
MAALECLRNIGAEEECVHAATKGDCMQHTRWCRSTAGEEFARIYSWGNDPARQTTKNININIKRVTTMPRAHASCRASNGKFALGLATRPEPSGFWVNSNCSDGQTVEGVH